MLNLIKHKIKIALLIDNSKLYLLTFLTYVIFISFINSLVCFCHSQLYNIKIKTNVQKNPAY